MKAVLEFDLETQEDRYEHDCAINGTKYKLALIDLDNKLRSLVKYDCLEDANDPHGLKQIAYDHARSLLFEALEQYGLDLHTAF